MGLVKGGEFKMVTFAVRCLDDGTICPDGQSLKLVTSTWDWYLLYGFNSVVAISTLQTTHIREN